MSYFLQGKTGDWELVIGLEVHCQIISNSKLFSGSSTEFGCEPNSNVSCIDLGLPGVLPSPNRHCLEQAIKTGLALNGTINKISLFDRKHYMYPDLPFGYQITQFYKPIMETGYIDIEIEDGKKKRINIERLHVEQDAGKLLHEHHSTKSFVDLNRAGVGLMEIVSAPDLRSKEEVASYVSSLREIVRYLETCDGNMDEGSMRCDINISVRKPGEDFRTRVEVKNVNSIKFIQQAIEYEANLHIETWESGKVVEQETKLFNSTLGKTYSLRKKSDAGDYRYIREPDILPIVFSEEEISKIKSSLPELPNQKRERYITEYKLSSYEASVLTADKDYCTFFEETLKKEDGTLRDPKAVVNIITTQLFGYMNKENLTISQSKLSPSIIGEIIDLLEEKVISSKIAKDVFDIIWKDPQSPKKLVEDRGLKQITNTDEIEALVEKLVSENLDKVEQIKAGKDKLLGWFVGQIMKDTQGKANPEIVNKFLTEKIFGK